MPDYPARRFDVHRVRVADVRRDPAAYGFARCECSEEPCPNCGGLQVVRVPQPCVGCGHCCRASPCDEAYGLGVKPSDRCPFLGWDGARYRCALAESARESLAIGEGCEQPLNSWRQDVKER